MKKETKLKTSRISFIGSYTLGLAILIVLILANMFSNINALVNIFFILLISLFFLEGEYFIWYRTFFVEKDKVSRIKGIFEKDRTMIPLESVAHTEMKKSVLGRMLGFGDVVITPFSGTGNEIILRGIRNPDEILKDIEENVKRIKAKS
ncbi:MAG: PH domain-containing protein [Candidatus Heimdallarchaeaceae archaeon]